MLNIKKDRFDIILNYISIFILILTTFIIVVNWDDISDIIPMHYDFFGNINRWGNKSELIILVLIMYISYILMTVIEKYPKAWNTGVKITEDNKDRVYVVLLKLLITTKFIMICIFGYSLLNAIFDITILFIPIFILILFGNIVYWYMKLLKAK